MQPWIVVTWGTSKDTYVDILNLFLFKFLKPLKIAT
jgi:hypothetical protein